VGGYTVNCTAVARGIPKELVVELLGRWGDGAARSREPGAASAERVDRVPGGDAGGDGSAATVVLRDAKVSANFSLTAHDFRERRFLHLHEVDASLNVLEFNLHLVESIELVFQSAMLTAITFDASAPNGASPSATASASRTNRSSSRRVIHAFIEQPRNASAQWPTGSPLVKESAPLVGRSRVSRTRAARGSGHYTAV